MRIRNLVRLEKRDPEGGRIELRLDFREAVAYNSAGVPIVRADDGFTLLAILQTCGYRRRDAGATRAA